MKKKSNPGSNQKVYTYKNYFDYLKDNPQHFWFKQKLYGWGWVPATWQGWMIIIIGLIFLLGGVYIGQTDDAPGATLLGAILMIIFILYFCYKKGEKPKWNWGRIKG